MKVLKIINEKEMKGLEYQDFATLKKLTAGSKHEWRLIPQKRDNQILYASHTLIKGIKTEFNQASRPSCQSSGITEHGGTR